MIKNLVLKGGGVCGIAYAGALKELETKAITQTLECVAGTSAGSIVAALVAMKYSADEINAIMRSTNFKSFEDGNLFSEATGIIERFGVHPGKTFLAWFENKIARKGLSINATFTDFKSAGFLDLQVFATNITKEKLVRFSVETTPNVRVAEAVRASMSIPGFFYAFQLTEDTDYYADGGCMLNYPMTALGCTDDTIGLFLHDIDKLPTNNNLHSGEIGKYVRSLFSAVLDSQNQITLNDAQQMSRTIVINTHGISATNFGLTESEQEMLYQSGRLSVLNWKF